MDVGSQVLDVLDYLFGPLERVRGDAIRHRTVAKTTDVETMVSVMFRTPTYSIFRHSTAPTSGALGTAVFNFCAKDGQDRLEIVGRKGSLSMSVFGSDGPIVKREDGSKCICKHAVANNVHEPLLSVVSQQLRGVSVPLSRLSTAESAARTSLIVDAVLRQYYRSRSDHFWARPHTWDNEERVQA